MDANIKGIAVGLACLIFLSLLNLVVYLIDKKEENKIKKFERKLKRVVKVNSKWTKQDKDGKVNYYTFIYKEESYCVSTCYHKEGVISYLVEKVNRKELTRGDDTNEIIYIGFSEETAISIIRGLANEI